MFSSNFLGVLAKVIIFTRALNWNNYGNRNLSDLAKDLDSLTLKTRQGQDELLRYPT